MKGSQFPWTRPFNDETEVRTLAQQALDRATEAGFEETGRYIYMTHPRHADFEAMVAQYTSMSYHRLKREMIDVPEVRKHFETGRTEDGYIFDQPMLVNMCRRNRD